MTHAPPAGARQTKRQQWRCCSFRHDRASADAGCGGESESAVFMSSLLPRGFLRASPGDLLDAEQTRYERDLKAALEASLRDDDVERDEDVYLAVQAMARMEAGDVGTSKDGDDDAATVATPEVWNADEAVRLPPLLADRSAREGADRRVPARDDAPPTPVLDEAREPGIARREVLGSVIEAKRPRAAGAGPPVVRRSFGATLAQRSVACRHHHVVHAQTARQAEAAAQWVHGNAGAFPDAEVVAREQLGQLGGAREPGPLMGAARQPAQHVLRADDGESPRA